MNSCSKCGGQGVIDIGGKLYECECERLRRIAMTMDTHIRKADVLDEHISHPLVDMVKQMVYVIGSWADLKSIVKVTIIKYYPRVIKVTSDAIIRNVFVGGASKNARSSDYEGEIYNNIQDYMDVPDLMVVRLNELSYKNRAAPGALEEAVMYRVDRGKPTWVVSDIDRPFGIHSYAYSAAVNDLFNSAFKKIQINRIAPQFYVENSIIATNSNPSALSSVQQQDKSSSFSLDPEEIQTSHSPKKRKSDFGRDTEAISKPRPKMKIRPSEDDDFPMTVGQGLNKKKKFGRD